MKKHQQFLIDKLTNSIEDTHTSLSYPTDIELITKKEVNQLHKKDGWLFNWKLEFKLENHLVYKLVLKGENSIQGLVSIELIYDEKYIEMHLIENAPANFGINKKFAGVAGNLVAFCCKR